jgi:hypothetical protein
MRKDVVAVTLLMLLAGNASARAQAHLAPTSLVGARLLQKGVDRERNLSNVNRALDHPAAVRAAAGVGTDLVHVRAALTSLSDSELRDLAQRASLLQEDPPAGLSHEANEFLVIFLIVAIVILVLKAAG